MLYPIFNWIMILYNDKNQGIKKWLVTIYIYNIIYDLLIILFIYLDMIINKQCLYIAL